MTIQQMLLGAQGSPVQLPSTLLVDDYVFGSAATASLTLANTGGYTSSGSNAAPSGTWLIDGAAADYECRATVTSGTLSSGTSGSWLALSTSRTWTRNDAIPGAESTCVFTLEIRRAADGAVLATCTVTLTAWGEPP